MKTTLQTILILLSTIAYSQEWYQTILNDNNKNFISVESSFLLDTTESIRGKRKEFHKWLRSKSGQLDKDGNILSEKDIFNNLQAIHKEKQLATINPNWQAFLDNKIAPISKNIPTNKGLARLHRLYTSSKNRETVYAATALAGLWKSTDKGFTWKDLTSFKIPVKGVWSVAENPKNSNIIILGDAHTMYRTEDAGITWKRIADTTHLVRDIYFNYKNTNIVYAGTKRGVFKSKDNGKTWYKILDADINTMRIHPKKPKIIYATEIVNDDVKIWVSQDAGKSFNNYNLPVYQGRKVGRTKLEVSKAAPNNVYIATTNMKSFGFGGLYISKNKGVDWEFVNQKIDGGPYSKNNPNMLGYSKDGTQAGGQLNYCFAFTVSQTNPNEMYVAGVSMWKSLNGGKSWENHSTWYPNKDNLNKHLHADIHDIVASNNEVWVVHDGGISYSENNTETFTDRTSGINALEILGFGINFHKPEYMTNASMHVGSMVYTPNTKGWYSFGGADDNYCGFGISNTDHVIHGAGYKFNRATWKNDSLAAVENITTLPYKEPNGEPSIHTENYNLLFQGLTKYNGTVDNNGSTLYRSTDFGNSWTLVLKDSLHSDDGRGHNARAYASKSKVISCWNNTKRLYYKNGGRLYESLDTGKSWNIIYDFNTSTNSNWQKSRVYKSRLLDLIVDPNDDNALYVTMRNLFDSQMVIKSNDGGKTWQDFSQGIPDSAGRVNSIVYQRGTDNNLYIGTQSGVYYRNNKLNAWIPYHKGLPICDVIKLNIDYKNQKLVAATFGRGIWKADLHKKSHPHLRITYNKTILKQGETLKLVDYSVIPSKNITYKWEITGPDSFTSTKQHPEFIMKKTGVYDVELKIYAEDKTYWQHSLKNKISVQ